MTRERAAELWRAGQHGWPRGYPLAQLPNAQLAVGLAGSVAARLSHGSVHDYASAVSYVGLGAWAFDELLRGDNGFRRALGAGMCVYLVVGLAGALGT